jgi:prepilin-type N-terminal cleavage/methylation domain-containing protein
MRLSERNVDNAGFSLVELLIAITILVILISATTLGIGAAHRRDTERYAGALKNAIQLTQTTTMTKAGQWRLVLVLDNASSRYYCVQQHREDSNSEWQESGTRVDLGASGTVQWTSGYAVPETETQAGLVHIWRFDPDTGACICGTERAQIQGPGRTWQVTVYRTNGYCEMVSA